MDVLEYKDFLCKVVPTHIADFYKGTSYCVKRLIDLKFDFRELDTAFGRGKAANMIMAGCAEDESLNPSLSNGKKRTLVISSLIIAMNSGDEKAAEAYVKALLNHDGDVEAIYRLIFLYARHCIAFGDLVLLYILDGIQELNEEQHTYRMKCIVAARLSAIAMKDKMFFMVEKSARVLEIMGSGDASYGYVASSQMCQLAVDAKWMEDHLYTACGGLYEEYKKTDPFTGVSDAFSDLLMKGPVGYGYLMEDLMGGPATYRCYLAAMLVMWNRLDMGLLMANPSVGYQTGLSSLTMTAHHGIKFGAAAISSTYRDQFSKYLKNELVELSIWVGDAIAGMSPKYKPLNCWRPAPTVECRRPTMGSSKGASTIGKFEGFLSEVLKEMLLAHPVHRMNLFNSHESEHVAFLDYMWLTALSSGVGHREDIDALLRIMNASVSRIEDADFNFVVEQGLT